jgi:hypothetical protein
MLFHAEHDRGQLRPDRVDPFVQPGLCTDPDVLDRHIMRREKTTLAI